MPERAAVGMQMSADGGDQEGRRHEPADPGMTNYHHTAMTAAVECNGHEQVSSFSFDQLARSLFVTFGQKCNLSKVKVMYICIAHIHQTSRRCSVIARIVKGCHSLTCTPCISSASGMSHTCLCFSSHSWYSFTDPGGM